MPTANGSGSDEVDSMDEVKVFNTEGGEEPSEKCASENMLDEEKNCIIGGIIKETEEGKDSPASSSSYLSGPKLEGRFTDPSFAFLGAQWGAERLAYFSSIYPHYNNGTTAMAAKEMCLGPGSPGSSILSSLYHNGQHHFGQPPPAHMGISPYQIDPKAGYEGRLPPLPHEYSMSVAGLRYPFGASGQYHYSLPPEFTAQMASAWFNPGGLMPHHPGLTPPLPHPMVPSPKTDIGNSSHDNPRHLHNLTEQKNSLNNGGDKSQMLDSKNGEKKPHIKKPLNAFMLYMKEMRAKVVAECTLKESAAINQILGRRWHALSRDEQAKYYEMARKERQRHMQMYPGWSSRQNYSQGKKKKRSRDKNQDGANMKKCRARYGLDQQNQWCKPCRRKKKCSRYLEDGYEGADITPCSAGSLDDISSELEDDMTEVGHSLSGSSMTMMDHLGGSPSSSLMLSPGPSIASPCAPSSLLMPSPASMSSPLTPGDMGMSLIEGAHPPVRTPVGTNPRDANNPLSVNQLTGQCASNNTDSTNADPSRLTMVRVT